CHEDEPPASERATGSYGNGREARPFARNAPRLPRGRLPGAAVKLAVNPGRETHQAPEGPREVGLTPEGRLDRDRENRFARLGESPARALESQPPEVGARRATQMPSKRAGQMGGMDPGPSRQLRHRDRTIEVSVEHVPRLAQPARRSVVRL